jgi:hypothetical protein
MCIEDEFQDTIENETNFCNECMSRTLRKLMLVMGAKNQTIQSELGVYR